MGATAFKEMGRWKVEIEIEDGWHRYTVITQHVRELAAEKKDSSGV